MFGLFIIEAGQEPRAVLNGHDNKPLVYATGDEAARAAVHISRGDVYLSTGWDAIKCQPRRLASDAWKAREIGRFADGTYVPLPWTDLPQLTLTAEHFPHVSTEDGAKVAYTQDDAKGAGDIQTRVKPGRYLTQFYGDVFDAPTIARMAAEFDTQHGESLELQFATTEDDIERVYTTGPHSCMAYSADRFASPVHPTRVYAAGDLAVAYLVRNNEITARALCWPSKSIYGRIYGDETRLSDLLESASFSEGDLDGARMLRIKHRGCFVLPYIDECQCAGDNGDYLILGGRGLDGGGTNGFSGSEMVCEACGAGIDEDDARSNEDGEYYCDCCYSDRYSYCDRYDEECAADTIQEVICNGRYGSRDRTTQYWGERAIENEAFTCEGNGKLYSNDFLVTLADGTQWSQDHFEDYGSVCEGDSECYASDDMVQLEDGTCWSKDYFASNGVTVDGKLYDKDGAPEAEDDDAEEDDATSEANDADTAAPSYVYRWHPSPRVASAEQTELPLPLPTAPKITAGSWVVCKAVVAGQFHIGGRYFVTRAYGDGVPYISVAHDDSGHENGWCASNFELADDRLTSISEVA